MSLRSEMGPFAIVPEWVLDSGISDRALRLYILLARYADQNGQAFPGRKLLAERMRCSLDSIDRAAAELRDAGAIIVEQRRDDDGARRSNLYTVAQVNPEGRTGAAPSRTGAEGGSRTGAQSELEPLGTRESPPESPPAMALEARGSWSVDRKSVTEDEDMKARAVLAEWNVQTGQRLTARGHLAKIVMRIREHPELSIVDHGALIAATLADPWWKGSPSPEVVYGNDRVFERALPENRSGPKQHARRYGRGMTTAEMLEVGGVR